MKTLVFGEILFDVFPDKKCIGGAPLNFAAHSVRQGIEAYLLTAVGMDPLGDEAVKIAESFGVNTSFVFRSGKPTGQVTVTLDDKGVPSYLVHTDTAYDNIVVDDIDSIVSCDFDCLYFGTLCQRNAVSSETIRKIVNNVSIPEIFCDVNIRPDCFTADTVRFCLENATILKISDEEEPVLRNLGLYECNDSVPEKLSRTICREFPNIKVLIITLGSKGSYAYDAVNNADHFQKIIECNVVSTVGAGDSFGAAFLASYLKGEGIQEALKRGAELSSFVVSHTEAVPNY